MFRGLNATQCAANHVSSAMEHLKKAKSLLLKAKSDQHIHLCMNLGALEEIHGTLTDPDCTPEIIEGVELYGSQAFATIGKIAPIGD